MRIFRGIFGRSKSLRMERPLSDFPTGLVALTPDSWAVNRVQCPDCGEPAVVLTLVPPVQAMIAGVQAMAFAFPAAAVPDLWEALRAAWNSRGSVDTFAGPGGALGFQIDLELHPIETVHIHPPKETK